MSICQLQKKTISLVLPLFSIIYLFGCAETPVEPKKPTPKKMIEAQWFKLPPRFSSYDKDENVAIHPFFDVNWKVEDYEGGKGFKLPYVVTTPSDSEALYEFDMNSGKLYRARMFCPEKDVWGSFSDTLNRPNFTLGFVPGVYNQSGRMQEIILFSSKEYPPYFSKSPNSYSDAKIIGSVILETCALYPCDIRDRWETAQILVGVPYEDPGFRNVENLMSLKKKVDWNYAKAMLANMRGNHFLGGRYAPSTRVLKEYSKAESRDYFSKNATILNDKTFASINEWRKGCMKMYDEIWDNSEKIRKEKNDQSEKFFTYFKNFYTKSGDELYRCQTLVRPANILDDTRRFWFFAFINAFTLLEKNGVHYNCRDSSWVVHSKLDFGRCRANTFEKNFEQAINGLRLMKTQLGVQYHFVEYDTLTGGSHQPIYGWLYNGQRTYACKGGAPAVDTSNLDIFPQDVAWESFEQGDSRVVR